MDVQSLDQILNEVGEFCVKLGRYILGGCPLHFCDDITNCPFKSEEIDLNGDIEMCYLKYVLDIKLPTLDKDKDPDCSYWIQVSPIDEFSITPDEDGELFISGRIGGKFSFAPDIIPFEEIPNEPLSYHDSSFNLFLVHGTDTVNWFLSEMDHKNIIDITHFDPEKCCVVDHCGKPISKRLQ